MKTSEIYKTVGEFKKFILDTFGFCNEDYIAVENIDRSNCEIKMKYEDPELNGLHVTSYKSNGSWGDIKVHIKPRVVGQFKISKND